MLQQRYGGPVTLVAFTLETGQYRVNRRYARISLLCRNNKSPRAPLCPGGAAAQRFESGSDASPGGAARDLVGPQLAVHANRPRGRLAASPLLG